LQPVNPMPPSFSLFAIGATDIFLQVYFQHD
jgi:hypothetical protein